MRSTDEFGSHKLEVARGERFEFGKNWSRFLAGLDELRIAEAERSLKDMLDVTDLISRSFLDIGSGSGLFSLAARRLGAQVRSFDYDPQSVACTRELRQRYFPGDEQWTVEEGSALDADYMRALGQFDVAYSWGVLHHTGAMWRALDNARLPVAPGGKLVVAIYNDMGWRSTAWRGLKRAYNAAPRPLRLPFVFLIVAVGQTKAGLQALLTGRFSGFVRSWTHYNDKRGMSRWYDAIDWIGGYPYEVATPPQLIEFYEARGFSLMKLKSVEDYRLGCNELVFVKGE
ncbi:MAG TPA: class I SAM-dependent methyltransferase [Burkholderiaceae bacterium]|nr:class I SAM-dependent methyltransferase [Burkholderiaceae bacterium]